MKRICVYSGSSPGAKPEYADAAQKLGRALVNKNVGLVFGGGKVGLMGAIADAVLQAGGQAIGVIPQFLEKKELAHQGLTKLHVVNSMHERKMMMSELSDGFIALPGGFGTMEELFEMLTWGQLGLHPKPCGLLNASHYFDHLIHFLDYMVAERFVSEANRTMILVEETPEALLEKFESYRPPEAGKWLDRERA